jgi:UTP:GlnB (protein PII) uridylyltransferase
VPELNCWQIICKNISSKGAYLLVAKTNISSLTASYKVASELHRCKEPSSDRLLVHKCAAEMAKAFGDTNMAKKCETMSLSYRTVPKQVAAMSGHMARKLNDTAEKCCCFRMKPRTKPM